MDRITKVLLDQFSKEYELDKLEEDKQFEHFSGFSAIRRHYSRAFDTEDVIIGGGGDTGIDAIAIIINNVLVTDVDTVEELAQQNQYIEADFIFVQAKRSESFSKSAIGELGNSVQDFFSENPKLARGEEVTSCVDIMNTVYKKGAIFRRRPNCIIYYVTTGTWNEDQILVGRKAAVIDDLKETKLFEDVDFFCFGAEELQKAYNQTKNPVVREFVFSNRTDIPETPGVSQVFLGFVPFGEFKQIITDESDLEVQGSIFYDNVRDWQEYNPVNDLIRQTLESDARSRFVLMNNGVTIIARSVKQANNRFTLEDFQIVNGCQTSHVLFDQRELIGNDVCIPLRLIETKDEDVIESIIHATNSQTALKPEQHFAVMDFSKKLEAFFQAYDEQHKLFYERRDGQYDRQDIEKTRIITPANTIRAFAAMFLGEPHRTTRNYAALRSKVGEDIFVNDHKLEPYYAAAYALYRVDFLFRNKYIEKAFKPAKYHLLLALRLLINAERLPPMHAKGIQKRANEIVEVMHSAKKADEYVSSAMDVIKDVTGGQLDRDHVRRLPITNAIFEKFGREGVST